MALRAWSRASRACARLVSGYTPNANSFSLSSKRYFSRKYLPLGVTSR